jgi:hypothetical protein
MEIREEKSRYYSTTTLETPDTSFEDSESNRRHTIGHTNVKKILKPRGGHKAGNIPHRIDSQGRVIRKGESFGIVLKPEKNEVFEIESYKKHLKMEARLSWDQIGRSDSMSLTPAPLETTPGSNTGKKPGPEAGCWDNCKQSCQVF